jgi:hypothetical protein
MSRPAEPIGFRGSQWQDGNPGPDRTDSRPAPTAREDCRSLEVSARLSSLTTHDSKGLARHVAEQMLVPIADTVV